MKNNPLLSLVIPTKNRYEYLEYLLLFLREISFDGLQIVLHDNSSDNVEFVKFLALLADQRVEYLHHPEWLSVSDNCELALRHATGDYICMLGDDDGVTPEIIDIAQWMKSRGVDAVLTAKPTYHWPGVNSRLFGQANNGRLFACHYSGSVKKIEVPGELTKMMRSGGTNLYLLPRVYHGIVAKKCLDELRLIAGTCFPGASPDIANAVGLTCTVNEMYYVDLPIIINGNCSVSAGGLGARAAHHGEIADMKFLPADIAMKWPGQVPFFWSGPTILAASAIMSLRETRRSEDAEELNFAALYASCIVFHRNYARRVLDSARQSKFVGFILIKMSGSMLAIVLRRLRFMILNLATNHKFFQKKDDRDLRSIGKAVACLTSSSRYDVLVKRLPLI